MSVTFTSPIFPYKKAWWNGATFLKLFQQILTLELTSERILTKKTLLNYLYVAIVFAYHEVNLAYLEYILFQLKTTFPLIYELRINRFMHFVFKTILVHFI